MLSSVIWINFIKLNKSILNDQIREKLFLWLQLLFYCMNSLVFLTKIIVWRTMRLRLGSHFFIFYFFCHTRHLEVEPISTFWLPQATSHSGCQWHLPVIWHHVSQRTKRPNVTRNGSSYVNQVRPPPLHNPVMFRHSAGFSGNAAFHKMIAHNQAEGWTHFQCCHEFLHTILC